MASFFPNKRTSRPKVFMSDEHHITLRYRVYTINSFGNSQWKKILVVLLLVTEYLYFIILITDSKPT